MNLVSIVVVTYNSKSVIRGCLASLRACDNAETFEIIVVDNCSIDGTPDLIRSEYPEVEVIEPGRNLGYAGGNNLGASQCSGEYLLLLNPDTIVEPDAVSRLVSAMSADPGVWIAGPCIVSPNGSIGHAWGDLPTLAWALIDKGPGTRLHMRTATTVVRTGECTADRDVGFVTGASMMTTRSAWDRLHGLDEDFFMYFEDADYCARAWRLSGRVRLIASARVVHLVGASVGQDDVSRDRHMIRGCALFLYKDRSWIQGAVFRWTLWVENALYVAASYLPGPSLRGLRANRARHASIMRDLARVNPWHLRRTSHG